MCIRDRDDGVDQCRFVVTITKGRTIRGKDREPFQAKLVDGRWTSEEAVDELVRMVADLTSEGASVRDIGRKIGKTKSAVARLQNKARGAGLL